MQQRHYLALNHSLPYDHSEKQQPEQKEEEVVVENYFDWFILGGDDLYIVVESLRSYLNSPQVIKASSGGSVDSDNIPLYLGRPLRFSHRLIYNTGGAGYLLNAAAVAMLATAIRAGTRMPSCLSTRRSSLEDVFVGECLSRMGVYAMDTKDYSHGNSNNDNNDNSINKDEYFGRERFHWKAPGIVYAANNTEYLRHSLSDIKGLPIRGGNMCCSKESISFQDVRPAEYMYAVHDYLYHTKT